MACPATADIPAHQVIQVSAVHQVSAVRPALPDTAVIQAFPALVGNPDIQAFPVFQAGQASAGFPVSAGTQDLAGFQAFPVPELVDIQVGQESADSRVLVAFQGIPVTVATVATVASADFPVSQVGQVNPVCPASVGTAVIPDQA